MDRFSEGESVLLGCSPQRSPMNPSCSTKILQRKSDVDFHDVFGGPPRRSSIHEIQHSFSELPESIEIQKEDEALSCPWPAFKEKPVFGEENVNRRRYTSDDFFDDIFRGDDSSSPTPRKFEREAFSSAPGSRVLSPSPSLPPIAEPFGSSSLPAQFSLPAKLTEGMDIPIFGSPTRGLYKSNSNGLSSSFSPTPCSPSSRFSSDSKPSYRQSPLSQEFQRSSEGLFNMMTSNKTDNLEKDSASPQVTINNGKFHFSIYKWASKGAPLMISLRGGISSRSNKIQAPQIGDNKQDVPKQDTSTRNGVDTSQNVQETIIPKPQSEISSSLQNFVEDVPSTATSSETRAGEVKEASVFTKEICKSEPKSLPEKSLGSESKVKRSKNSPVSVVLNANEKKEDEKRTTITGVKATTAYFQADSSTNSGENRGKSGVKGKVKEFVHVFNREPPSKPKDNVNSRSQDSKSKQRGTFRAENEVDEDKKKFETENSGIRTTSDNTSSGQDDKSTSSTAPVPDSSGSTSRYTASDFQGNFVIDELGQVENELPQTSNNRGEILDIDAKIRKWSSGKEGNIRSLLSTLQYVLWPESGWKPVPLVNIIEGNAVKRAYQKALLCLHPDKLQQKGATSHQKYIAEKVFDILKEAWTHFNLVGAV